MKCKECLYPQRRLWTYLVYPEFIDLKTGNWISLKKCPACDQLWCEVPYEPYAAFKFWAAWPYSIEEWERLNKIDSALILHEWHSSVIREDFKTLPEKEKEAVEHWRDRSYRNYNPIDRKPDNKYCTESSDLDKYIKEGKF